MAEGGEWERKTPDWWQYRLTGAARPFADVLRQRADGPDGARWDALLGSGMRALAEGVSLEAAKTAVEHYAADSDRKPWEGARAP